MSKSSCRFVVTKKDDCCYKTTTETVVGLYGVAVPAFPTSSTKDSVHVVRYDDALVTYAYNGTAWIETTNTPITSSVTPGVLVDNGDGTYTWTDTATTFVIDTVDRVLLTAVYSPATQDFTFTWSNGDTTVVDLTGLLNIYSLLDGNNTVVTGNGVSIPWEVNGYGVADNSDGTFTVTLPDGVTTFLIDTNETVTNIVGNTYTNEVGTAQPIIQTVTNAIDVNGDLITTVNGVPSTPLVLPSETVTTLTGVQATGKTIGTYTNEAAAVVDIKETITSFASITNGYQFTAEDGTVYPFTFVFDNSTPSSPQLLINYGATTVSTIPLNSYDVNIATTGGFALNPLTDVITITETDGETHTIDLTQLRTTLTSTDGSVELVTSVNPDGSTNYDLGVTAHSNETQAVPYTGTELPSIAGVNVGDTKTVQFSDGTVVSYTWDGADWVLDFVNSTATAQRPWIKVGNTTETSATNVLSSDDIYHIGKANIGGVLTHQTFYDAQIDNGLRVHGPTRNTYDNYSTNAGTLQVNPITGNDNLEPREYIDNGGVFKTLNAAINYINNSSFTGFNTIVLTGTTALAPALLGGIELMRGKVTEINANGEFISITGNIENYGTLALNWGTYNFTGNFRFINWYNSGFYAYTPTFNLSAANTTSHFIFRVGASGVFDTNTINYAANNTSFAVMETNTSVMLGNTNFQTNGFTGCKLGASLFNFYAHANTFNINATAWININAQALDVTNCTIIHDNRYYHGFVTLPATTTDQNLNVYAGNLKIYDVLKFDNNASATVDIGVVWATSATNTVSLPEGVLMIKY